MAVEMDLRIETKQVALSLDAFSKASGIAMDFVVHDQMRLWLQDLIKFSPPQKGGAKGGKLHGPTGRKAVATDLNKILAPVTRISGIENRIIGGQPFFTYSSPQSGFYLIPQIYYDPGKGAGSLNVLHKQWRQNRTGRIVRRESSQTSMHNGLRVVKKTHVKRATYNAYIRKTKKHVGRLASSWVPALQHMARKVNTTPKYAKWLNKVNGSGSYVDAMTKEGNGYVKSINGMPYAEYKLRGLIPKTRLKRQKDITQQMEKRMERMQRQFNAGKLGRA